MEFNSKHMKKAMFLIAFAITFMWLLNNIVLVWGVIAKMLAIISPFIIGLAIAFILNIPMKSIEHKMFGENGIFKNVKRNLARPISYVLSLLLFVIAIYFVSFIIFPELAKTMQDLVLKLPDYWKDLEKYIEQNLETNPQIIDWINNIEIDWVNIRDNMFNFLKNSVLNWIGSTFSIASSVVSGLISFVLGFVFSIYVLLQKEKLIRQTKKLIAAFLSEKAFNLVYYIGSLSNKVFSSFLSGQLLEAIILGGLFFIAMSIFKFPYALMISVLIGVTALIPVFGAFIGCFIGAFLILLINPVKALWFIVMFLIIQQIEGNLIYPQVVGKASGLPSIWVLVAVSVGGSLGGPIGMLIFIPLVSVIYTLLSEYVNFRLKNKNIAIINTKNSDSVENVEDNEEE